MASKAATERRIMRGLRILSAVLFAATTKSFSIQSSVSPRRKCSVRLPPPRGHGGSSTSLYVRPDLDVVFGSSNQTGGVSWGADDDDDDMPEDETAARQARVAELLAESDDAFKQSRKLSKWGNFANISNANELQIVLEQERQRVDEEQRLKADTAAASGVSYTVLEARPDDSMNDAVVWDETGHVQISGGLSSSSSSWFAEMDEELENEWKSLTESSIAGGSSDDDNEEDEEDSDNGPASVGKFAADDVQVDEASGKMVAREALAGVRVGSAGGWSLEVFPGDFVVHRKYGIGRFERTCLRPKTRLSAAEKQARDERRGEILSQELRQYKSGVTPELIKEIRAKFGTEQDTDPVSNPQTTVLEISYADAVVHVPVDRAYRLSRYRAGDSVVKPKLSRVRGEAWAKAKRKVEENTLQLAQDVLALYATRETLKRTPFDPAVESRVKEFEKTFTFEPTPDQIKCFEDVENDMVWRSRPMDRLVCGDVGFGKTEVAFRALFRTIANGRQAALLAPTGVLASQHYKNVVDRLVGFNVEVAMLRGGMGKATKMGRELRERIANGDVQLIVGTHALLSNNIEFKDLGMLCVDEEQRFGVKQKERLKLICNGVDVLTLSATPIPRTLQMSLSGIRDTSTIRSPPPMRKSTITFVQEISEGLVQEAIGRELDRGGQCYYVVPRISMLDDAEAVMKRLFPGIKVIQAHGRMQRNGAEENVGQFASGSYDVLLATTVIENGVDIPTVNTIVVENSQAFGMSTLYQLRGRVGRSDKQGYAYFLHREESLTEQAAMRLQAIGELSKLGSGFDVANRDLEIRGAGSLLGTEQSGMAARVGFDLYMRMLKKSIRKLRGLDLPLVPRTNILLNTQCSPDTFKIPAKYLLNGKTRKTEETKARLAESTTALVNLTKSWKETYGSLPPSLQKQLKTMHLHACTRRLGVDLVGLVKSVETDGYDCVLRSPGLRPRHWATIVGMLQRAVAPKGLDVIFPARFTLSGEEEEIEGGRKLDLKAVLTDETLSEDQEEEEWDAMDEEEIEAMKDISSAINVKEMDSVDLEQYPRFVIKDFDSDDKSVDRLLKVLLPVAKVVCEKQAAQAEDARAAADLREKQELLRTRKRVTDAIEAQRLGYRY